MQHVHTLIIHIDQVIHNKIFETRKNEEEEEGKKLSKLIAFMLCCVRLDFLACMWISCEVKKDM